MSEIETEIENNPSKRQKMWDASLEMFQNSEIIAPIIEKHKAIKSETDKNGSILTNKIIQTIDSLDLFNNAKEKEDFKKEFNEVAGTDDWSKFLKHPAVVLLSNLAIPFIGKIIAERKGNGAAGGSPTGSVAGSSDKI